MGEVDGPDVSGCAGLRAASFGMICAMGKPPDNCLFCAREDSSQHRILAEDEGRAAGRTVDHVHLHLIPRHTGDVEDPRGGIRHVLPGCDADRWATSE
jgi:hypothetical protein